MAFETCFIHFELGAVTSWKIKLNKNSGTIQTRPSIPISVCTGYDYVFNFRYNAGVGTFNMNRIDDVWIYVAEIAKFFTLCIILYLIKCFFISRYEYWNLISKCSMQFFDFIKKKVASNPIFFSFILTNIWKNERWWL